VSGRSSPSSQQFFLALPVPVGQIYPHITYRGVFTLCGNAAITKWGYRPRLPANPKTAQTVRTKLAFRRLRGNAT